MACILCTTGFGMTKRKGMRDGTELRCHSCHRTFDREIAETNYAGCCPECNKPMKLAVNYYNLVCTNCDEVLG